MGFLVFIGLLYGAYKIYEACSNSSARNDSIRRGSDIYVSKSGNIKDVKTNQNCYLDGKGNKKFF